MVTKSVVKAVDNSVQVKLNGEFVYVPIDDVKVGGMPLKSFMSEMKKYCDEQIEKFDKRLSSKLDETLDMAKANRSAIEKTVKGLITR